MFACDAGIPGYLNGMRPRQHAPAVIVLDGCDHVKLSPRCNSARWVRERKEKKSDPNKPFDKPTGLSNGITIGA